MQKMDKTVAKKKNCKQKKLVCVSSHLRTLHFLDFIDRRLKVVCVYVAFFRGPGECPAVATVTSASCLLLLLRLAFLPRPSPADPAPKVGSHGRQTEAATFFVDGTFPRVWHKYSCSNCSDKVSNTKITKKHLTTAHWGGGVFSYLDGRHGTERSGSLAFWPRIDSESFWRDTTNVTYSCNFSHKSRIDVSAARLARFVCTYPLSSSLHKCSKVFCVCPFGATPKGGWQLH